MSAGGTRVPLLLERLGIAHQRRGRELWASCPAHEERTPSWHIRDEQGGERDGLHNCFSCGFAGGPVALVRLVLGCESREALAFLADPALGRPTPLRAEVAVTRARWLRRFALPGEVVQEPLHQWPTPARRYLERRRVGAEQAARYELGYAVEGKLEGRVVVPVLDGLGRPTAYAARSFVGDLKRWLEATGAEGASRSAVVGQHLWGEERDLVVVVEGAFDALAADAAGFLAAGVRGSGLDPQQALAISRFARVVVASDPDPAGEKLHREIRAALARTGASVRRARLRDGVDLAKLHEREGVEAVKDACAWDEAGDEVGAAVLGRAALPAR